MTAPTPEPVVLLTIPETAERLRCSENHVYRLIAAGELDATDISRKGSRKPKTRVPESSLLAFVKPRTTNARRLYAAS